MKHLMRGVSLGLFDESAATQKFEQWNAEHEQLVAKREETHRKHKQEKRHSISQESVRRVEEKQASKIAAAAPVETEAPAENNDAASTEETTQEG
jgi:small subunit ribosomal protein S16